MIKQHKTAIVVAFFLFAIIILSALNLYFLLENVNTREDRVRQSVEKVLQEVKQGNILAPTAVAQAITSNKEIQYIKGADGQKGLDGVSIKGDKGEKGDAGLPGKDGINGKDGKDAPLLEIRCNILKNRWEIRYALDNGWKIMNNTPTKCTLIQEEIKQDGL
jgi:hypothetical protein